MRFVSSVSKLWIGSALLMVILAGAAYGAGAQLAHNGVDGDHVVGDFILHSSGGAPLADMVSTSTHLLTSSSFFGSSTADQPNAEHIVEVRDNTFTPGVITIDAGDTVVWQRIDGFHSVTADDGSFDQPVGDTWSTFSHTFTTPGEYLYHCTLHGGPDGIGMAGMVIVRAPDNEVTLYLPEIRK